jgi:DNA modification methylase
MHAEMRRTCGQRSERAAEIVNGSSEPHIVWCNTNYEADALKAIIPGAIEVRGSDSPEEKERKLNEFTHGEARVIITKPSIAGYGLNWQHCCNVVFVGLSYSFEDFYQAVRRSYRFGQSNRVNCYIIQVSTEENIASTVKRKMEQHEEMRNEMKFAAECLRNEKDKELTMTKGITTKTGNGWTAHLGDCVRVCETMDDNSIDFSVYSPPFANLYIYSSDAQDMGNCDSDEEFFDQYRHLIAEKYRVTRPGCLTAVHSKNLVMYKGRDGAAGLRDFRGEIIRSHEEAGWVFHSEFIIWKDPVIEMQRTKAQGLLFKQLRDDSRFSRAGMPEYVTVFRKWGEGMEARPVEHEQGKREDWNYIGSGEIPNWENERHREIQLWQRYASPVWMDIRQTNVLNGEIARESGDEKHICPLQLDVIERLIWLYTNKGDLVFSPFTGIGSEGCMSIKLGRRFVGTELKPAYFKQAVQYLQSAESQPADFFAEAS